MEVADGSYTKVGVDGHSHRSPGGPEAVFEPEPPHTVLVSGCGRSMVELVGEDLG